MTAPMSRYVDSVAAVGCESPSKMRKNSAEPSAAFLDAQAFSGHSHSGGAAEAFVMSSGWIKLHRSILEHPRSNDPEWFSVWAHLLLLATHRNYDVIFGGKRTTLQAGQLITSRDSLARKTGVNPSKVERILKWMEIEQQIEQRSCSVSRLITLTKWAQYQAIEQQIEHRPNTDRTPTEHKQEGKEGEEEKNIAEFGFALIPEAPHIKPPELEILEHLNTEAGKSYRAIPNNLDPIRARLSEVEMDVAGVKQMISRKVSEWKGGEMEEYLRPETLFRPSKFNGYYDERNQPVFRKNGKTNPADLDKEIQKLADELYYPHDRAKHPEKVKRLEELRKRKEALCPA